MAATVAIAAVVIGWLGLRFTAPPRTAPWETPTGRAHRICEACGLKSDEIDRLIETITESPGDREALIRSCEATYDGDAEAIEQARKLCDECVDAVLGAAESENP